MVWRGRTRTVSGLTSRRELTPRHPLSYEPRFSAPAVELVRALRHRLHEMTTRLAWVERQDVTGSNGRVCALRREAAELRRDIKEAQALIDRLQQRYLVIWHDTDGRAGGAS